MCLAAGPFVCVVGIATSYRLNDRGVEVRVPVASRILSSRRPDQLWGPLNLLPGTISPGVKLQGREADHSPPASAEVKKNVDLYVHSPIRLYGVVLNRLSTGTTLPLPGLSNLLLPCFG
jgi:hypothetical protein